ncbi:TolC family protein [Cupriavidus campinensis]|uniref:TolC family protein n=1 Tax=Cupriavidus campinensis TaxID=151783 RepID=A0ABY3ES39_9BURK|nr:TolC family protein [Cupriavidus campinensis]TSP13776.1 TolC family protein [Cupriavidus campinensis]
MTIHKTLTWVASLSLVAAPAMAAQPVPGAAAAAPKVTQPATTKPAAPSGPVTLPRAASPATMAAADSFDLPYLLSLAQSTNKGVEAAQANVDAASAAISTARAYPNPQVEVMYGRLHGKEAGVASGNAPSYAFVQKFDYPQQRSLRQEMAGRGLEASQAVRQAFRSDLSARVKTTYYQVLRRETELAAAQEDLALMRQIHSRAKVRVDVGEAPRYELIKAETELLAAQKTLQTTELRVEQAKTALRQQVGGALPPNFRLTGTLGNAPDVPMLPVLRDTMQAGNAELAQRRMELERARLGVDYQRSLRWPEVAVRASTDRQPDNNVSQIGLVMTIPLWDRRSGPVGEAAAQATQARTALEAREFELNQELETAYRQYEITQAQVTALESGIVREAESALGVAEAAYRFGERGILDYLDAQRVLRNARSELIAAQYELQVAAIQIEKLMSTAPGTAAGVAPGAPGAPSMSDSPNPPTPN